MNKYMACMLLPLLLIGCYDSIYTNADTLDKISLRSKQLCKGTPVGIQISKRVFTTTPQRTARYSVSVQCSTYLVKYTIREKEKN